MILLVVMEISASIAGYVKKDDVSKILVDIAEDSMNNWNNTVVQSTWDEVQVFLTLSFRIGLNLPVYVLKVKCR